MDPTSLRIAFEQLLSGAHVSDLTEDPAVDTNDVARLERLGLGDQRHGEGFPQEQARRMVEAAKRRLESSPFRVAKARARAEAFLHRLDATSRATVEAGIEPSTMVERCDDSLGGIARGLEAMLPRRYPRAKAPRIAIAAQAGRSQITWIDVPGCVPVDALAYATAKFQSMGGFEDAAARRLAEEFVAAVRNGADVLPGYDREAPSDPAHVAYRLTPPAPLVARDETAFAIKLAAMFPAQESPPLRPESIGEIVRDLVREFGVGEAIVRQTLLAMLAARVRALAPSDRSIASLAAHARSLSPKV